MKAENVYKKFENHKREKIGLGGRGGGDVQK